LRQTRSCVCSSVHFKLFRSVTLINADVNAVLSKDETKRRLADLGSSPAPMTVEAFAHYDNDLANYKKLIQETGIKAE
jgi:hypothetical protein